MSGKRGYTEQQKVCRMKWESFKRGISPFKHPVKDLCKAQLHSLELYQDGFTKDGRIYK